MLLRSKGDDAEQAVLGLANKTMGELVTVLNRSGNTTWLGNSVSPSSFDALNSSGSWAAMLYERGGKTGHWVVVDGVNDAGRVLVRDPWNGTKYNMERSEFMNVWTSFSVYRK